MTAFRHLVVLLAAAGCARTSADRPLTGPDEPAAVPEPPAPAPPPPPEPAPAAGEPGPSPTVTGVFIEDTLAAACGLPALPEGYFQYDSATIEPDANALLRLVAECLATGPLQGRRVELRAYNDPRADREIREELALAHAREVADFLAGEGVPPDNIEVSATGETAAAPDALSDWPYARRIDVVLLPPE
ncbi:MAG TPA: OmpA family protein [Nannocystis sp.]